MKMDKLGEEVSDKIKVLFFMYSLDCCERKSEIIDGRTYEKRDLIMKKIIFKVRFCCIRGACNVMNFVLNVKVRTLKYVHLNGI